MTLGRINTCLVERCLSTPCLLNGTEAERRIPWTAPGRAGSQCVGDMGLAALTEYANGVACALLVVCHAAADRIPRKVSSWCAQLGFFWGGSPASWCSRRAVMAFTRTTGRFRQLLPFQIEHLNHPVEDQSAAIRAIIFVVPMGPLVSHVPCLRTVSVPRFPEASGCWLAW